MPSAWTLRATRGSSGNTSGRYRTAARARTIAPRMSRPKPKYKPAFVPRWTASPDLRAWPPVPFRDVYPVGNRAGANWQTVASNWSVDVADLIWFNFGTNDPRRINWYLHYYVGCHKSNDGKNFSFREADPGLIYIPPDNWKRPETVPSLNKEVAGISGPLVAHFPRDVALSGVHITRGDFAAVVHAIRTGASASCTSRAFPKRPCTSPSALDLRQRTRSS